MNETFLNIYIYMGHKRTHRKKIKHKKRTKKSVSVSKLKQSWIQSDWLDEFDEEPEIDSDFVHDLIHLNVTLSNYRSLIKLADYIQVTNVDVLIDKIVLLKDDVHCIHEFEDFYRLSPRLKPLTRDELKVSIKHWTNDELDSFMTLGHISYWDISNITDMSYMFYLSKFNEYDGDISKWNVSNVTNMRGMFINSEFNGDISEWDVSNVTNMEWMFANSVFNDDISEWDVSNVTSMSYMFFNSDFNGDISDWDVSNVTDMEWMFANSVFNDDISEWDVSNVTSMSYMFASSTFNGDISQWDVSKVTNMDWMFHKSN